MVRDTFMFYVLCIRCVMQPRFKLSVKRSWLTSTEWLHKYRLASRKLLTILVISRKYNGLQGIGTYTPTLLV